MEQTFVFCRQLPLWNVAIYSQVMVHRSVNDGIIVLVKVQTDILDVALTDSFVVALKLDP